MDGLFANKVSFIITTKMNRKAAPEVYLPSNPKNYTYYPIEQKKPAVQPLPDRSQPTLRHERNRDRDIEALRRANDQLREREEIYIQKLMRLQEGLQNQHKEFVKLQELYTELFESYKQKELQISELEFKYRESSRRHYMEKNNLPEYTTNSKQSERKDHERGVQQLEIVARQKQWLLRQAELMDMNEHLTQKLLGMNENYEKVLQELNALRSKEKGQNKGPANEKIMAEIQEWQRTAELQKESRIKYQYENQFLKNRNKDLETQREELEKLLAYKQKQIGKLREEKIHIHRQTSEKIMNRSLSTSSRAIKVSPEKANRYNANISKEAEESNLEIEQGTIGDSSRLQQFFSFSRERKDADIEEGLPSFPPELQIDSLINEHRQ